jgi:hypothetical protein
MEELNNAELLLLECGKETDINGVAGKPLAAVAKVEVLKIASPYINKARSTRGCYKQQLRERSEVT